MQPSKKLGRWGGPQTFVPLLKVFNLQRKAGSDGSKSIILALGRTRHPKAVEVLAESLTSSDYYYHRQLVAEALALNGAITAADTLIRLLTDPQVRETAAKGLECIQGIECHVGLLATLRSTDSFSRLTSSRVLTLRGNAEGIQSLAGEIAKCKLGELQRLFWTFDQHEGLAQPEFAGPLAEIASRDEFDAASFATSVLTRLLPKVVGGISDSDLRTIAEMPRLREWKRSQTTFVETPRHDEWVTEEWTDLLECDFLIQLAGDELSRRQRTSPGSITKNRCET